MTREPMIGRRVTFVTDFNKSIRQIGTIKHLEDVDRAGFRTWAVRIAVVQGRIATMAEILVHETALIGEVL